MMLGWLYRLIIGRFSCDHQWEFLDEQQWHDPSFGCKLQKQKLKKKQNVGLSTDALYTTEADIKAMASAIANTKVDPYSTIQHALNVSPLIEGTALVARQNVDMIMWQAAKSVLKVIERADKGRVKDE